MVQACNALGDCTDSTAITATTAMINAIGYFKASNTDVIDEFGYSVALSADGNTLAVSAPGEDSASTEINGDGNDDNASRAGAVYLFSRTGNSWSQQAYLKASNTDTNDWFGQSVALSANGNTLAVGAIGEDSAATGINDDENDDNASKAGAVYLFSRTDSSWSQQAYLKASNTDADDEFGTDLALSADGNTLAVSARGEGSAAKGINGDEYDDNASWAGAVYLFSRTDSSWSQQAYLKASNTDSWDLFGQSVALSADGNTLAVGAYGEDSAATGINGDENDDNAGAAGAVYLFSRTDSSWSQQAYIKASNTDADDRFGWSVALSADGYTLAVGAYSEDSA
ncbi:MAG: FG-GAP repeat protein, partial [Gammaproteobacteria bacterium]|nr:FG-GAP repeat protein [Gammaproteobacteria bacterium]